MISNLWLQTIELEFIQHILITDRPINTLILSVSHLESIPLIKHIDSSLSQHKTEGSRSDDMSLEVQTSCVVISLISVNKRTCVRFSFSCCVWLLIATVTPSREETGHVFFIGQINTSWIQACLFRQSSLASSEERGRKERSRQLFVVQDVKSSGSTGC